MTPTPALVPSLLLLNYETVDSRLVRSLNDTGSYPLRPIYEEDTLQIELRVFRKLPEAIGPPFFQILPIGDFAIYMSIGLVGTAHSSQGTWTQSSDGNSATGNLPVGTMGGAADNTPFLFEIRLTSAAGDYRGQFPVLFKKSVSTSGTLSDPVADVALGTAVANQVFARKIRGPGEPDIYPSENGQWRIRAFCDNNGRMQFQRERVQ